MKISKLFILALSTCLICSCGSDPEFNIENPSTYAFNRDGVNTVSFSGQTTRIAMATELIDGMTDLDNSIESILQMYSNQTADGGDANPFSDEALNASTKSVKSKVAASFDFFSTNTVVSTAIKDDLTSWMVAQFEEVAPNKNELAEIGKAGQIGDGTSERYINAKGLEYDQAVNKSLIGALMVDQMLNNYLSPSILDEADNKATNDEGITVEDQSYTNMEHKWDEAYGYLFGASSNPASPLAALGEDDFLSKYLLRVETDEDFAGIADDIYQAFKLGRAAIVAGDYETRDKQADIIKEEVSKIIGIRAVYYLQQGKIALNNNDFGGAFHDLSEGFGFVYSLRFTRKSNSEKSYFTNDEVNGFISSLQSGNGFWDITDETLDALSDTIASKFDFTVAQAAE